VHLFGYGSREQELLTPGDHPVVVPLDRARVGLTTCYDLRFPELYRRMVDDGAELFLVVAGWPFPRLDAWRTLGRARAIENQAALVACNAAGRQAGSTYAGASYACGPWGSVLGELDDRPGVLRVDVDLAEVAACRRAFPALRDRVL
jgi:predicted amidohydrolase